jgi:hypothetical protein
MIRIPFWISRPVLSPFGPRHIPLRIQLLTLDWLAAALAGT